MSGFPLLTGLEFLNITLFLFLILIAIRRRLMLRRSAILIVFLFLLLEIIQHLLHGPYSWRTSLGTFIKLSSAYLVVQLVSKDFFHYYVKQIVVICVISFLFYFLQFNDNIRSFLIERVAVFFDNSSSSLNAFYIRSPSILLYTFEPLSIEQGRNSGPFWEPGGFACFILLALIFSRSSLKVQFLRHNWILILALVSTFSTMGLLTLFILVLGTRLFTNNTLKKLTVPILFVAGYMLFNTLDILKDKIENNIVEANFNTSSRFGSAVADFALFSESPVVGWGRGPMRYGGESIFDFRQEHHRNNGIFILLATYGIVGVLIYFYNVFKSLKFLNNGKNSSMVWTYFTMILFIAFSQDILFKPLFLCLVFFSALQTSKLNRANEIGNSNSII